MTNIHEAQGQIDGKSNPEVISSQETSLVYFGIRIPELPKSEIPIVSPDIENMPGPEDYVLTGIHAGLSRQLEAIAAPHNARLLLTRVADKAIGADFAINVTPLARRQNKNVASTALEVSSQIKHPEYIKGVTGIGAYLNFEIDMHIAGTEILSQIKEMGDKYGEQNIGEGKRVVIDLSSPNIAKHMSVGHLRSTVIGESLARIYKAAGYEVIRDNHLGDWGTQFGMLGRAVELWGDEFPELQDPNANKVNALYKLYVQMHDEIKTEKEAIKAATGLEDPETSLEKEGKDWFRRLEEGDPEAYRLWNWARDLSMTEFERVYDLLDDKFEYQLGESEYIKMLPDVVQSFRTNGIADIDEKNRIAVDLSDQKMDPLVIQKSDGTSLYSTRDLACLAAREAWFDPEKILYVVGGDQQTYFKQVFAAFDKLAGEEGPEVQHVYFGLVKVAGEKMSTREGRVVFLEDVIRESIKRAHEKMFLPKDTENRSEPLPQDQALEVARQVGVGAVIYSDLKQVRERNIDFNLDEALSFEGNSGPYLQYAHARARSIERKALERGIEIDTTQPLKFSSDETQEEIEGKTARGEEIPEDDLKNQLNEIQNAISAENLLKLLGQFPEAIAKAIKENQPSIVAEATFKVADEFNKFYHSSPVLAETNPQVRNSRLRLTVASAQVIRNGLNLLGIEAPERM